MHSDYGYLAVRLDDQPVVHGCTPEWEPIRVAGLFDQFVSKFVGNAG